VTGKGEARIALDVGRDAVYFDNPDLPETRSEMALPLRVHNEIIGALDVQSTSANAFTDDDIGLLQIIADQVSMLVSNLQLYQQAQENLEEERNIYRTISQAKWQELLRSRPLRGYVCNEDGTYPLTSEVQPAMPVEDDLPVVKIPIQLRGQVLGVVEAHKPRDRNWTKEEIRVMETLVDQLSTALESARLFQDTQRRAERERLAGEITAKVRASNDPQTILQTAVRELRQVLQANRVQVLVQSENPSSASIDLQNNGENHSGGSKL
jgi:GAF domain-containing protein